MSWCDPSSYDDRDLARTIGNLDGFVRQLLTHDGRGLSHVAAPLELVAAVNAALNGLGLAPTGDLAAELQAIAAALGSGSAGSGNEVIVGGNTAPAATVSGDVTTGDVTTGEALAGDGSPSMAWRSHAEPLIATGLRWWSDEAARRRLARNTTVSGSVAGLFLSKGGVPKLPALTVTVGPRGIDGDVQKSRQHHGRPWQALCLWSVETIDRLRAEGHPIEPGFAGENVLVTGVDWADVIAGTRIRVGSVLAEITITALPCSKNAKWFNGGEFDRMHHAAEPGVSRMYAAVIEPGEIALNDPVVVELR